MPGITVTDAVAEVTGQWASDQAFAAQTTEKFTALATRFAAFSGAKGVRSFDDVDEQHVAAFIGARGRSRSGGVVTPAVATMQNRRAVLRAFYRTARSLGLTFADPARDVVLPDRAAGVSVRPLSSDEAQLVWFHAWDAGRDTRFAATIALLLAGVQSGEAAHITISDLDLDTGTVRAHGASKYLERWLPLGERFLHALCVRAEKALNRYPCVAAADLRLATQASGSDAHLQARIGMTAREVLVRAGLGDDPTLKPSSLTAFAGARAFMETGRIEQAAKILGLTSLDTAAKVVGHGWND